jgi:polysaccharide export outer membrane protein
MTHNSPLKWLAAITLLISFAETGVAQVAMRQTPNSLNRNSFSVTTGLDRANPADAMHSSGMTAVPQDFARMMLAPGFLLELSVLDDPDFVGSFRIDQQGNLALPILGTMHVAGKTVSEARGQIRKKLLDDQILKDPQVNLTVLEYTAPEVTIIGEVTSPGKYPLLAPRKLLDVLALAGGTSLMAADEVQITTGGAEAEPVLVRYSRTTSPKAVEDVIVHPGDTVLVKRAGIVYVLGAVNRPGGYVMQEEGTLSVLQAISLANGTAITASTGKVYLLHRSADGSVVDTALPYGKISRGKSTDVQLHATDVLFVPTSKMKAIFINSQSVMASTASASIYAVAVH